jgi:hypothetical protein
VNIFKIKIFAINLLQKGHKALKKQKHRTYAKAMLEIKETSWY